MKTISAERERPRLGPDEAARKRVAVEFYARNETTLRHTARRYSLCVDDAEDALQRGLEILLRKAPTDDPRQLIKWMQTVVKHEALAIRRERERTLSGPAAFAPDPGEEDWVAQLSCGGEGPDEKVARREAVARSREALQALKPQELRALTLLAEGYSYVEIGEITGYSQSKINKSLAAGRRRFRALVARSEEGQRCAELQPLLSAFCDGEAPKKEVARIREHLRACAHCRAALRAYRAAPAAAAALSPFPLDRSLWERVQDAVSELAGRFGGGASDPVAQVAGGGAGGTGIAAAAKVAAVCIGTAGAGAACVAGGLVPSPLDLSSEQRQPQRLERRLAELPPPAATTPQVEYEPAPVAAEPERRPKRDRSPAPAPEPEPIAVSEPVAEPAPVSTGEAVEYVPPPEPEPVSEPPPEPSSGGSPAGEFGP